MTAPTDALAAPHRPGWLPRLLAAVGFALALALGGLFLSQQVAVERARGYARDRFKVNIDVPVHGVRPTTVDDDVELLAEPPPLGFCWGIELEAGVTTGEVFVNPWTHDVVGWRVGP